MKRTKQYKRPSTLFNLNPIRYVENAPQRNPLEWKLNNGQQQPSCSTSAPSIPSFITPIQPSRPPPPPPLPQRVYQDFGSPQYYAPPAVASYNPPTYIQHSVAANTPPTFASAASASTYSSGYNPPSFAEPPAPSFNPPSFVEPPAASYAEPVASYPSFFATPAEAQVQRAPLTIIRRIELPCAAGDGGYGEVGAQLAQLLKITSFTPRVVLMGNTNVVNFVAGELRTRQVKLVPFTGQQLKKQAVNVIYNPEDATRLRYINEYATLIMLSPRTTSLPELPDKWFIINISFARRYEEPPLLLYQNIILSSNNAYNQRLREVGYIRRAVNSVLADDYSYIYDDRRLIIATNEAKITLFVNIVVKGSGARFLLLSAHPLENVYAALTAAGIECVHLQIINGEYTTVNVPETTQVLLQEYDPLIGQTNLYNIDYFWPGPRHVYLLENPVNSLALNFLLAMQWINAETTVLAAQYKNSQVQTTDQYFAQRTRQLYSL